MLTPTFSNRRRGWLVVGDLLALLAFAAVGRRAHSMGSAMDDVVGTALPFLLAWLVVAPFTGAYGEAATETPARAARRAALTWALAFPLGLLVRVPLVGRVPHISFAVVAGTFTLLTLSAWRALLTARIRW